MAGSQVVVLAEDNPAAAKKQEVVLKEEGRKLAVVVARPEQAVAAAATGAGPEVAHMLAAEAVHTATEQGPDKPTVAAATDCTDCSK